MATIPARAALCLLLAAASAAAESAAAILARMDQAALSFKAMSANVSMTMFTKVINDESVETGTLEMQRLKGKGTRAVMQLKGQSDAHVVSFFNNTVRIYYPKLKLYQDYDVGKSVEVLSQFLLLGFGSSGKELMESYDISNDGTETVEGRETTKLLLIPKSPKIKEKLSKVEVWIPNGEAYPVAQQFFEPNGNYRVMRYSNLNLNPPIKGNLEFKPPPGTKKQGS